MKTSEVLKLPEVRIYFSWLLYENVSVPLSELEDGEPVEEQKAYWQYTANYRYEWAKYSEQILTALIQTLGVEFYQSVIDAPCTPGIIPLSDPLALNFAYYPDQFVDSLTHELCHVLLNDNTVWSTHSSEQRIDLSLCWRKLFGKQHSMHALVHIPVHALSKYVYLDVLQEPKRLERDMKNLERLVDYKAAWEYVNAHDYREIIQQLREDYQALAKELA